MCSVSVAHASKLAAALIMKKNSANVSASYTQRAYQGTKSKARIICKEDTKLSCIFYYLHAKSMY
jgi:hypothetical protein